MGQILRIHAIREIVLPTAFAMLTITFVLMVRWLFELIELVLLPGVGIFDIIGLVAGLLPNVMLLAAPMAILIGILIGVGRMTMDGEVLAIRASGVNLISIFAPALALAFAVSGLIYLLSATLAPLMMYRAGLRINQFKTALVDSLEPGRFYDKLLSGEAVLYFESRGDQGEMKGITLEIERTVKLAPPADADTTASAILKALSAAETSPTTVAADAPTTPSAIEKSELTLIFAREGRIAARSPGRGEATAGSDIILALKDGVMHQLAADPAKRDYTVVRFDSAEKRILTPTEIEKPHRTLSNAGLNERIAALEDAAKAADKKPDAEATGALRKELWQRRTIWPAAFVFALVGIPLAIWVRPSGKSWGIMIATALMLIYYVLLQMGLTMVRESKPAGALLAFMPNLLYAGLGLWLWRQTLRS